MSQPAPLTESLQRQRLFEALAQAVLTRHQPLLLLIDDMQWCDRDTLQWLHYLLRFDPQARLLVVGTLRPEDIGPNHPLTPLLVDLRRSRQLNEMELGSLDAVDTAALAAYVAGQSLDPHQAAHLYTETEGNPLFVVETVRAHLSTGAVFTPASQLSGPLALPPGVQAAIVTRLAQLSPTARELAGVAAAVGREFTFEVLTHASDSDEEA